MRTSKYPLFTLKHTSLDTSLISHKLMIRSGMIRKLSSGLYIWLPIGLKVLKKIENIIRKEMNNINGIEISMPIVQPSNLWKESGRLYEYGSELLKFTDRNKKILILGPTHEEVITNLVRNEINSYKQLPLIFYQINTKFRDEMRPCLGVIRSKEFIMKDAYSFHVDKHSLKLTYDIMYYTYSKILNLIGLNFYTIKADNGYIGGDISHEFHIPICTNNSIQYSSLKNKNYNVNVDNTKKNAFNQIYKNYFCNKNLILLIIDNNEDVIISFLRLIMRYTEIVLVSFIQKEEHICINLIVIDRKNFLINKKEKLLKLNIFIINNKKNICINKFVHFFSKTKFYKLIINNYDFTFINKLAMINMKMKRNYFHKMNTKLNLPIYEVENINNTDIFNLNTNTLSEEEIKNNSIEIGHIFQLGNRYTKSMNATIQNRNGHVQTLSMGCYGIGITRLVPAIIEQNHNDKGILWPENLSPFDIVLLPINMHKSFRVAETTEYLYYNLIKLDFDVLLDDRKESVGVMFSDMELIGITHQLIISEKNLNNDNIEYKNRLNGENRMIKNNQIIDFLLRKLNLNKN